MIGFRASMRLLAIAAVVLFVPVASAVAEPIAGMGISPLRIDADVRAGGQGRFELTVTNSDSVAAAYAFSVVDIRGDKDDPAATPVLLGGKLASAISGYDWITPPDAITVPAGQRRTVVATVRVPADAKGGHYAAVLVTSAPVAAGRIDARSQIAVPFLMNAGNVPPPEVKVTEVKEFTDGGTKVVYTNEGETHTRPKGSISYRDPITGKIIKRDTNGTCTTALPGGAGECRFPGSRGGSGSSSRGGGLAGVGPTDGFVELVTEEGARARGDLPTQWAGTWTSMMLPLAGIALFVMYFLFLRRRRKQREEGDGDADDADPAWGT